MNYKKVCISIEKEENTEDELRCPGCYKTRSYAWENNKCNSCGYDEEKEDRRANN